jgi:hypothetical protein
MKYDSIKKKGEQWVRIRPALQVYNDSAVLKEPAVEDDWWLSDISEDGVKLTNRATQHVRYLGLDHVHHYMDDPNPYTGGVTGILVLNVQLLMFEGVLHAEPILRPGQPLEKFVPARSRETLFSTAARAAAFSALTKKRKEYAWSVSGVQAAQAAFRDLEPAFKALSAELAARDTPVPIRTFPGGNWAFLMNACGWWVSCTWDQRASNVIEDGLLNFRKYDNAPQWPNLRSYERATQITVDQYRWDLVSLDEARWVAQGNAEKSYTTTQLAERVLTALLERPNDSI